MGMDFEEKMLVGLKLVKDAIKEHPDYDVKRPFFIVEDTYCFLFKKVYRNRCFNQDDLKEMELLLPSVFKLLKSISKRSKDAK